MRCGARANEKVRIKNAKKRQREFFPDQCTLTLDLNNLELKKIVQRRPQRAEIEIWDGQKESEKQKEKIDDVKEQEERKLGRDKKLRKLTWEASDQKSWRKTLLSGI